MGKFYLVGIKYDIGGTSGHILHLALNFQQMKCLIKLQTSIRIRHGNNVIRQIIKDEINLTTYQQISKCLNTQQNAAELIEILDLHLLVNPPTCQTCLYMVEGELCGEYSPNFERLCQKHGGDLSLTKGSSEEFRKEMESHWNL